MNPYNVSELEFLNGEKVKELFDIKMLTDKVLAAQKQWFDFAETASKNTSAMMLSGFDQWRKMAEKSTAEALAAVKV